MPPLTADFSLNEIARVLASGSNVEIPAIKRNAVISQSTMRSPVLRAENMGLS